VNKGFGELWKKNSLLDKFGNYWKEVARAFKENPYVIGFELVNEPWPGNLY
jgi:endoglycosylceramidase